MAEQNEIELLRTCRRPEMLLLLKAIAAHWPNSELFEIDARAFRRWLDEDRWPMHRLRAAMAAAYREAPDLPFNAGRVEAHLGPRLRWTGPSHG